MCCVEEKIKRLKNHRVALLLLRGGGLDGRGGGLRGGGRGLLLLRGGGLRGDRRGLLLGLLERLVAGHADLGVLLLRRAAVGTLLVALAAETLVTAPGQDQGDVALALLGGDGELGLLVRQLGGAAAENGRQIVHVDDDGRSGRHELGQQSLSFLDLLDC